MKIFEEYDERTEEFRKALDGKRTSYEMNKLYMGDLREYLYYISRGGFYHILMPGKVRWNSGEVMCYTVDDFRLNPDNTMELTMQSDFKTVEERTEYVNGLLAKAC